MLASGAVHHTRSTKRIGKLNDQVKDQYEEICSKDKVNQALQDEIKNHNVGMNDIKTMAISQLNVENKILKSAGSKEMNARAIVGARSKVTGFLRKIFLPEKKLTSKQFCSILA